MLVLDVKNLKNYGLTERQKRILDLYHEPANRLWKLLIRTYLSRNAFRRRIYPKMSRLWGFYFTIMDTINFGTEEVN